MPSFHRQPTLRLATVVAAIALAARPVAAQVGTWTTIGPPPGGGVQLWDIEALGDRLFGFGNGPAGLHAYEILPPCDLATEPVEWVELARSPGIAESYFRVAALNGRIYLPGGGLAGSASSDQLLIFTPPPAPVPGGGTWAFGPPVPRDVNGYALAVVDGEIYLAGGCCGNREELFVFDGVGWRTEDATMLAPPRAHPAGVGVEGTFMALGGYDWPGTSTYCDVDVREGDVTSDGPALPLCRSGHAAVACGRLVYVLGGWSASGTLTTVVDVLDTATGTWSAGTPMPSPAGWASARWFQGRLWVFPLMAPDPGMVFEPESGECVPDETLHSCACDAAATRNHGQYVSCVARVTQRMVREGRMTREERQAVLTEAAQSDIGKR